MRCSFCYFLKLAHIKSPLFCLNQLSSKTNLPLSLAFPCYFEKLYAVCQSCPTLCNPMDCSPSGSSVHGNFPGRNIGVDCHFFLQGIFLTQGSNLGLPSSRQILDHLTHRVRIAIIKKSTNSKCWRGYGEKGNFLYCQWECKLVESLWRTVWRFFKKTKNRATT